MSDIGHHVRIDNKGKYYTKVVSTQELEVLMRLRSGETIRGMFHIRPGRRLSDEMNDNPQFLAVTKAVVTQGDVEQYRTSFLSVNRRSIEWLIPVDALSAPAETQAD